MDRIEPKYKVGDLVAFRNRCQPGIPPFQVRIADTNMYNTLYMVNGDWWQEGNLMPFEEWKKK